METCKQAKRDRFSLMIAMILAESAAASIVFGGECVIEAAIRDGEGKTTRPASVAIVAYNGGSLIVAGYNAPVYVDLDGIEGLGRAIPLLRDHDKKRPVGTVEAVRVGNRIEASGRLTGRSADRVEVEEMAADGFEWQASVGVQPRQVEAVQRGKTATVNGQTINGPAFVARKSRLAELTLCTVGADAETHVAVAAELDTDSGDDGGQVDTSGGVAALRVERDRRNRINTIAATMGREGGDLDAIEAAATEAINGGLSPQEFELRLLRTIARPAGRLAGGGGGNRELRGEQLEQAVEASVMQAIGWSASQLEAEYDQQTLNAMDRDAILRHGLSLQDLLMFSAEQRGAGRVSRRNVQAMLEGAFAPVQASGLTTFDLSGILSNVANKMIKQWFLGFSDLKRVTGAGEKLQAYAVLGAVGSVTDFKQRTSYALTGDLTYEEVKPGGELKHGTLGEQSYTNQAKTYGKIAGIDRTDIINDDLNAFGQMGRRLGRGAAVKLASVFWSMFMNNSAFFTTGRNNYAAGAGTALSIDGYTQFETLFLNQTDPDGLPLGVMPSIGLVPTALDATLATLLTSATIVSGNTTAKPANNPHGGKVTGYSSPYLSNASFTGYSALAWYLLADPQDMPVIETVFLNGKQQPTVEQSQADFSQLGVQMRGYHDFGCNLVEYRGGVKAKGEA